MPSKSAFRGSRSQGISDRRVSFYDSLPRLAYGPTFTVQLPHIVDFAERRGGLLLPAITADDRNMDNRFRAVQDTKEQSDMSLKDMQPAARHDSSVEPISLRRTRSARRSGISGRLSGNAERRRSCMDLAEAMMRENARSRSRTRPLSLLADKAARGQSPRPAGHVPADVQVSRRSSHGTQNQILKADDLDNIPHAYEDHVDRTLRSMQGTDKRGSAYLHESLVKMQEALDQAMAETTTAKSPTDENEVDHACARPQVPRHPSEAGDSNASNNKTDDAFSFEMPYDSAQPSAEAIDFTKVTHVEAPLRLSERSDDNLRFDQALMPLPLRIRPRQPRRDSTAVQ